MTKLEILGLLQLEIEISNVQEILKPYSEDHIANEGQGYKTVVVKATKDSHKQLGEARKLVRELLEHQSNV